MFKLKVFGLVIILIFLTGIGITLAQTDGTCEAVLDSALETAEDACGDLAAGQACYGAGSAALTSDTDSEFSASGDIVALEGVESLQTHAADWGTILLEIPQGDAVIKMALFGDAEITNLVQPVEGVTLPVENGVGYNINMRERPSTGFQIVGMFLWNASGTADGRNAEGSWLHVQVDGVSAWVSAPLVKVEGDIEDLPVMDSPYTQPMQALTLRTSNAADCGGASGLLAQYNGDTPAQIQVNGVELTFRQATLLMRSDAELQILAVDGSVDVLAAGEKVTAQTGALVQVALVDMQPSDVPVVQPNYSFAAVEGAPISLVSSDAVCVAGVTQGEVAGYAQPDADASVLTSLNPDAHYDVTGWADAESGERWWRLHDGQRISWVPQDSVQTAGLCSSILEIDPNAPLANTQPNTDSNAAGSSSASEAPAANAVSTVPEGRSIWSANSGEEHSTGTCNFPPLAMCQHLVAITPNPDGTISWRGQEPQPYTLYSSGDGFFSFRGRNHLNNANLSMALTFNGEGSWTMTMTQVFDNDPQCVRTFYYTASRQW